MDHRFDLHHIQRSIILSLATKSPLSFTELQPPHIPNNTFSYHLKKLVENGYVEHALTKSGYLPTRKALKLMAVKEIAERALFAKKSEQFIEPAHMPILSLVGSDE